MENPPASAEPCQLAVSVLVVSYKTRDLTSRCIQSVYRDMGNLRGEVLVADNQSSDGTVEVLEERFPRCKVQVNLENLGFGRAQNQLARASKGERLLILNPDTELHSGCLLALNDWLDRHPDTAMAGPRTLYPDGRLQTTAFRFPSLLGEFLTASSLGLLLRHVPVLSRRLGLTPCPSKSGEVDYLQGSCLLCRREAFEVVGGFDESYFLFSEEVDLQRRLHELGWKRAYVAEAAMTHHHGKSMEQDPIRNYVELYRGKIRYFGRHASGWQFRTVKKMWTLFHFTRWALLAPLGILGGGERWKNKARKHMAVLSLLRSSACHAPIVEKEV